MADKRYRNWMFIIYPESAKEDWRERIEEKYIEWVESPLHDKDKTKEGELKKPHVHVLLLFNGKKSYANVLEITEELGATIPKVCMSAKTMVRYFAHMDTPEKYQYPVEEIKAHGGVNIESFIKLSESKEMEILKEILDYIVKRDILDFETILGYARRRRSGDWFPLISKKYVNLINTFLKSRYCNYLRKIGRCD